MSGWADAPAGSLEGLGRSTVQTAAADNRPRARLHSGMVTRGLAVPNERTRSTR